RGWRAGSSLGTAGLSFCARIFPAGGVFPRRRRIADIRNCSMTFRLARSRQWRSALVWLAIVAILLPVPLQAETTKLKNGVMIEGGYGAISSLKTDLLRKAPPITGNMPIGLVDDDLRRVFFGVNQL